MDGWITIGTDVDGTQFDKELKRLQKQSEKFDKEEQKLLSQKAKLELDTSNTMNELSKIDKKMELINKKMSVMRENNLPEKLEVNTDYQKLVSQSELLDLSAQKYYSKLELQKTNLNNINKKISENANNQDILNVKIAETAINAGKVHLNTDNIGNSITNNIRKIGKWITAIFGIRTALSVVTQMMSSISNYNDKISNKLYSAKMFFSSALEPIIERLVNLIYKLLVYINYISKAWFGVDLFARASANATKAAAKNAKELKKTLTGFDDATVLNDSGGTSGAGVNVPKFVTPEDVQIPSWIKWIADNKDIVIGAITGLGIAMGAIKVVEFFLKLKSLKDGLFGLSNTVSKSTSLLTSFGKVLSGTLIIGGLVLMATHVFNLIKNWDNLTPAEKSAEVALIALGVAFTALGLVIRAAIDTATFGIAEIIALGVAVIALKVAIMAEVASLLLAEGSIKSVEKANKDLKTAQDELKQATDNYVSTLDTYDNALKKVEESAKALEAAEKKNKISGEDLFNQVQNGSLTYQDMNVKQKEVYKAYMDNIKAEQDLKQATDDLEVGTKNLTEAKHNEKVASWDARLAVAAEKGEFEEYKKAVVSAFNSGELNAQEARDAIGKSMSGMSRDAQKTFMQDLPNDIKNGLDPKQYETVGQKLSKFLSGIWDGMKSAGSKAFNWVKNKFGFAKGGVVSNGSVYGFSHGGVVYPKLQYCASGAIINQPGRGVPITQAIGGERGQEGILPLTDSQQMDLLGQSIARHMNINLTNINQMNGKVISRELVSLKAEQDFATNS